MPLVPAVERWFPAVGDHPGRDPAGCTAGELALFCLPYAGGSSSAFRGWAAELRKRAGVQVRPAQLPGRETRITEPPHVDVGALTDAFAHAVTRRGRRPYAVYGHSMGARLGFEVLRGLRRRGLPLPTRFFVGGSRPPHMDVPIARIARLPDQEFCARLVEMGGTPPGVLDEPELRALLLPVLRADLAMVESYTYRPAEPLPVPVVAFAGRDDPEAGPGDMVGWSAHTTGGFELHTLAGNHFFLNSARAELLGLLASRLDAAGLVGGLPVVPPADDEVCVVEARLDDLPELTAATGELGPAGVDRAAAGPDFVRAARTVGQRVLLRRIAAGLGMPVGAAAAGPLGSPGSPGVSTPPRGGFRFDTSHCGGIALVALTRGREVGVAVRRVRPGRPGADLDASCRRALSGAETAELAGLSEPDRSGAALRIRTAKDAVLAAAGHGAEGEVDPARICFAGQTGERTWRPRLEPGLEWLAGWRVRHLDVAGAVAAVAVGSDDWRLRYLTVRKGAC